MTSIQIRFYEELNDFLPQEKRKRQFRIDFLDRQTVKDIIESQGAPHSEVDLILVNGESVGFGYIVRDGDSISVYPEFETLDISELTKLRPSPLRYTKFIADVNLGRLAKYLRMLGFDTAYRNDLDDPEIVRIANDEKRIILTRDIGILKRNEVQRAYWVRSTAAAKQIREVVDRFNLAGSIKPFTRCMECNGLLEKVDKESISHRLEAKTRQYFDEFFQCADCGKIYWKGSHYERMMEMIEGFRGR